MGSLEPTFVFVCGARDTLRTPHPQAICPLYLLSVTEEN